jgi:disulfide bond formation protein DsbB
MLNTLSTRQALIGIFLLTSAVILGAYGFQYMGYEPCELCLKQRFAYYAVIPLSLIFSFLDVKLQRLALILSAAIMLGSMIFGIYHAGVEWKFWQGPTTCTGGNLTGGLPDLTKKAVMCDQPAIIILGLSLAGWNAIISACTAWFAWSCARKGYGSNSASQ